MNNNSKKKVNSKTFNFLNTSFFKKNILGIFDFSKLYD